MPLADVRPGAAAVVRRIDEELENRADYMLLLEQNGLVPDAGAEMIGPDSDGVAVLTSTGKVALPRFVAARVFVTVSAGG